MTAAAAASAAPRLQVGRYLVLGKIGRGGMGMVFQALDEALEREVALKVLTAEGLRDVDSRRRFAVEAKAAAQLQHPNIVTIFELGEERGIPFIAMEYLPGVDLESLLRSGEQVLLAEKLEIMAQVCRGLSFAHERGIVHRDVKPSNIRLLDDGGVKIMDFGIAKLGGVNLTQSGMVVGTVHYMSPEQVRGQKLDGRSDIFSAGVVLFELLTGARPFDGGSSTEILFQIVHAPTPALPESPAGPFPQRLKQVLAQALEKEPDKRHPNAAALAEDLAEVQAQLAAETDQTGEERISEAISGARRLLKEGRFDESIAHLDATARAYPMSVDARRALRLARRMKATTGARRLALDETTLSELAATFQLPITRPQVETREAQPPARVALPGRQALPWAIGIVAVLAVLSGLLLVLFGGEAAPQRLVVQSEPQGARVFLGGKDTGVVTNGELLLDPAAGKVEVTFRKEGYLDVSRTVTLPLGDRAGLAVTLAPREASLRIRTEPRGATVKLNGERVAGVTPLEVSLGVDRPHRLVLEREGFLAAERELPAGKRPDEIVVKLSPVGPPASVSVVSSYPLDVVWNGETLARGQTAPRVSLPPGRQVLTLVAPRVALRTSVSIEARAGQSTTVTAPGLGRLNAQARPDNCEIWIDGVFADYPPIRDRDIVAGSHRVEFRWPGGRRAVETTQVEAGRTVFVVGRPH